MIQTEALLASHGLVRRGRHLVLLASDAAGAAMLDVSADLVLRYAARIGADVKIVRQENHGSPLPRPHAVKFHTALELAGYDAVAWIDADCLVAPHAPDIFAAVPADAGFAAWCDEHRAFADRPLYAHGYFNSGVMVARDPAPFGLAMTYLADKETRLTEVERAVMMGEQTPLNRAVHDSGVAVHRLGPEWNFVLNKTQRAMVGTAVTMETAHIVHCAGGRFLGLPDARDRAARATGMRALRDRLGW